MRPITHLQRHWLADVAAGQDPLERYHGRSARGGANTVWHGLIRRGLIKGSPYAGGCTLTDAGRAALAPKGGGRAAC